MCPEEMSESDWKGCVPKEARTGLLYVSFLTAACRETSTHTHPSPHPPLTRPVLDWLQDAYPPPPLPLSLWSLKENRHFFLILDKTYKNYFLKSCSYLSLFKLG
jgi:hypothetical protein